MAIVPFLLMLQLAAVPGATADAAMANYSKFMRESIDKQAGCHDRHSDEIIVCARDSHPSPRLPLPDERPARVAPPDRRADSAAAFEQRLGCRMGCDPTESAEKGKRLIKIITGEDPDSP